MELDEQGISVRNAARDPMNWPLELGETLIVYHPHAKLQPRVVQTKELAAVPRSSGYLEDSLPSNGDDRSPHFPFKTLADFEQTELFIRRDHTDGEINDQLDLWRRHAPCAGVTLKNAREMHQYLDAAGIEEDLTQVMLPQSR